MKSENESVRKVLDVGGNSKTISIPDCFNGWQRDLLDIDPRGNPDILCDARELWRLPPRYYDAVHCSHNLEHYYRHDVPKVLKGFRMILKKDGFAYINVPDLLGVMKMVVENGSDLEDMLYLSPAGPISASDVIYGLQVEIERSGNDYYAHKTGFTEKLLTRVLKENGFPYVYTSLTRGLYNISALAFLEEPNEYQKKILCL